LRGAREFKERKAFALALVHQGGEVFELDAGYLFGEEADDVSATASKAFGLAPLSWRDFVSACRPFFELDWAEKIERRMAPDGIVEGVDIASNRVLSLITCVEDGAPGAFPFQVRKTLHFFGAGPV